MSRPPQRFVIRRISTGAKTNLPWTLTDSERPSYIGRHPTMTAALAEADRCSPPVRWVLGGEALSVEEFASGGHIFRHRGMPPIQMDRGCLLPPGGYEPIQETP